VGKPGLNRHDQLSQLICTCNLNIYHTCKLYVTQNTIHTSPLFT